MGKYLLIRSIVGRRIHISVDLASWRAFLRADELLARQPADQLTQRLGVDRIETPVQDRAMVSEPLLQRGFLILQPLADIGAPSGGIYYQWKRFLLRHIHHHWHVEGTGDIT
ncbi:hypothetical protein D3C71_678410 [compost metagenome]